MHKYVWFNKINTPFNKYQQWQILHFLDALALLIPISAETSIIAFIFCTKTYFLGNSIDAFSENKLYIWFLKVYYTLSLFQTDLIIFITLWKLIFQEVKNHMNQLWLLLNCEKLYVISLFTLINYQSCCKWNHIFHFQIILNM